jgi:diaminopimelate decarboxylase
MDLASLSWNDAQRLSAEFGTPVFLYDEGQLVKAAEQALAFPAPFGLTVRYAMKAAPNRSLLRLFAEKGLHFDASSGWELQRLLLAGIPAERISLSTQELPVDFAELLATGATLNACSLNQLERFGEAFPGCPVGLRFNPGLGSGSTQRTNVGGPASSFGIWHEDVAAVKACLETYNLKPFRVHSHIGSGSNPAVWEKTARLTLAIAAQFPEVTHLNLGGGFKVARMPDETATDLQAVGAPMASVLEAFAKETGRRLHLEIEPGTFLVANAGALLSKVQDLTSTGPEGFHFIKLDSGMTELLRPSLYGSQHPIKLLAPSDRGAPRPTVVVGHCCESGDILTPAPADPEGIHPRPLPPAERGDFALIGGTGAYGSTMAAMNYNSFPAAAEVLLQQGGNAQLIRRRQSLGQIVQNEVDPVA